MEYVIMTYDQSVSNHQIFFVFHFILSAGLMYRFIKEKTMKEATSADVQVPFDQESEHKGASKVDIGFAAEAALSRLKSQKKISDRQVLEIKTDCKTFLKLSLLLFCPAQRYIHKN